MSLGLPEWIAPMMAQPSALPSGDDGWAYEMKWDGVRASAYFEGGRLLRLVSRTGRDVTVAYPELLALGPAAGHRPMVLDGEIVAFGQGRPSFETLQPRIHVSTAAQAAAMASQVPVTYLIFDLLYLDGDLTLPLSYRQRRERLDGLLAENEDVERIVVFGVGLRDETVVRGIEDRGMDDAIDLEQAGRLVELVFDVGAERDLDHRGEVARKLVAG